MRLPFLQISQEEIARARTLAGYLGVSPAHAVGMVVALKAAALEAAPEGDVSGVITDTNPAEWIAVQCGWQMEGADRLAAAMARCGFVMARPSGGYAVAGMEPYAKALDTAGKRSEAGRKGAEARKSMGGYGKRMAEPSQTHGKDMARDAKTQTQTQTQKESSASQGTADAAPPSDDLPDATDDAQPVAPVENGCPDCTPIVACWKHLPRDKPGEKPPRKPSEAQTVYARMQEDRRKRCEAAGEHFVEDRWDAPRINRDIGAVLKAGPEAQERFGLAWDAFLADDSRAGNGWSLTYFIKGAVRSMYETRGLKAGAA